MVSKKWTGGEHDDRMQALEDELRIMRNESKEMMNNITEMVATMIGVKPKENRRSLVGPRRPPPSKSAPKGLWLHREQEIRENVAYDDFLESKLAIKSELYPRRLGRRGYQERMGKLGVQTPRVSPLQARLTKIFDTLWAMLTLQSAWFRSSIGINEYVLLWTRYTTYNSNYYNFVSALNRRLKYRLGI